MIITVFYSIFQNGSREVRPPEHILPVHASLNREEEVQDQKPEREGLHLRAAEKRQRQDKPNWLSTISSLPRGSRLLYQK